MSGGQLSIIGQWRNAPQPGPPPPMVGAERWAPPPMVAAERWLPPPMVAGPPGPAATTLPLGKPKSASVAALTEKKVRVRSSKFFPRLLVHNIKIQHQWGGNC